MERLGAYIYAARIARKHFKNWYIVILCSLLRLRCRAVLRAGGEVTWNARQLLKQVVRYEASSSKTQREALPIKIVNGYLIRPWFGFLYRIPLRFFMMGALSTSEYKIPSMYPVDVDGKVVLDVGAYIGDTSLYFLYRGAARVIAVEPVPEHFEVLKLNAEGKPIVPINAAVGHKIPAIPELIGRRSYGIKEMRGGENWLNVPVLGLIELVEKYRPQIVKLNCEGCEHFVLEDLTRLPSLGVEKIIIQFHDVNSREASISYEIIKKVFSEGKITFSERDIFTVVWEFDKAKNLDAPISDASLR